MCIQWCDLWFKDKCSLGEHTGWSRQEETTRGVFGCFSPRSFQVNSCWKFVTLLNTDCNVFGHRHERYASQILKTVTSCMYSGFNNYTLKSAVFFTGYTMLFGPPVLSNSMQAYYSKRFFGTQVPLFSKYKEAYKRFCNFCNMDFYLRIMLTKWKWVCNIKTFWFPNYPYSI